MRRTSAHLADGREIIYFDRDGRPERTAVDLRPLPRTRPVGGELRQDPLSGAWVAVADHRQDRIHLPDAAECPLCPSTPARLSEIPEADYDVVVFENRFPTFPASAADALGPVGGRCEVVAFTPDHLGSLGDLDDERMGLVLAAWIDRTEVLAALPGVRSVFVFENRGADVGVTLHHPHGQIYAYPFVPPMHAALLDRAAEASGSGARLLAHAVEAEIAANERLVFADEHWVAFVPFAASWPYEVQVHPRRDVASLTDLDPLERASLVSWYPRLIRALDRVFDEPLPYLAGWLQRPAHPTPAEERGSRLFLRLISNRRSAEKLKYLASSESLMGAFILDVVPEAAAASLRAAWEQE